MAEPKTVVITGATGYIGGQLRKHLASRYDLRLIDKNGAGDPDVAVMDLSRWNDDLVEIFHGADAVIHLAADPSDPKTWEELIPPNIDALNNVYAAAIIARTPRVIFASSNHVMGGYKDEQREGRWLSTSLEHKPGTTYEFPAGNIRDSTPYGAMKLFGERLGRCYAQAVRGVSIAVRIGWVNHDGDNRAENLPADADPWFKGMWLSNRDLCDLMEKAITANRPPGSYHVVNGMSDNQGMVWNIEETKALLGYAPRDGITLNTSLGRQK